MKKILLASFLMFFYGLSSAQSVTDTLIVGVYDSPPFVITNSEGALEGVSVWLWEKINQDLNRPYKFKRYKPEQKPLKSTLEDLAANRIDFSINPLTITSERNNLIDFTYPFYIGNLTIVKRSESSISTFFNSLGDFFNARTLTLTLIVILLVATFGFLIWKIEMRIDNFEKGKRGLLNGFWWSAVTMTTVGYGDKVPKSNLGRLIAFAWMLCSVIILSVFTANITSTLTVRRLAAVDLSIENFKKMNVGTVESSAMESYLRRNFFRDLSLYPEFLTGLEGLSNGETEIFVYDEPWLVYQVNNNPKFSDLEILPIRFNMQLYAMPLSKSLDSTVESGISASMLRIMESNDWQLMLNEYQLKHY